MNQCPCSSERTFALCCEPILAGTPAASPEALVRARYTAFVKKDFDFIERTHAPEVRDDFNRAEAARLADEVEWDYLRIHSAKDYGTLGEVEYVVSFRKEQKPIKGATTSKFRKENGEWFYVSSKPAPHIANLRITPKVGRNDVCPCGSGRKYKKCCANPSAEDARA